MIPKCEKCGHEMSFSIQWFCINSECTEIWKWIWFNEAEENARLENINR